MTVDAPAPGLTAAPGATALLAGFAAAALPLVVRQALRTGFRARARVRLAAHVHASPARGQGARSVSLALRLRWAWVRARIVDGRGARAAAAVALLEAVGQRLRAGQSLAQALRAAVDEAPPGLADDLRHLAAVVDEAGTPTALRWWAGHRGTEPLVRATAAALGVAVETGGPALPAVEAAAAAGRARDALVGEVRALTAQARASAAVIGAAPVVMAALSSLADPAAGRFLLTTAPGLGLLVLGLTLDAIGVAWMVALLRRFRA